MEEKDQAYGPWLRAYLLPKFTEEVKRETSSGTCNKSLFSPFNTSKVESSKKRKVGDDEVNQDKGVENSDGGILATIVPKPKPTPKDVEEVAESLGTVAILSQFHPREASIPKPATKARKWTRHKAPSAPRKPKQGPKAKELGKRTLIDVVVAKVLLLS